jgi:hypothetical protein
MHPVVPLVSLRTRQIGRNRISVLTSRVKDNSNVYVTRVKVAPANLRSEPSNQFACVKRLLNIVIGAKLE